MTSKKPIKIHLTDPVIKTDPKPVIDPIIQPVNPSSIKFITE